MTTRNYKLVSALLIISGAFLLNASAAMGWVVLFSSALMVAFQPEPDYRGWKVRHDTVCEVNQELIERNTDLSERNHALTIVINRERLKLRAKEEELAEVKLNVAESV